MLVLHVVAPGEVGGLERVVHLLAKGQAQDGAKVHVALVDAGATHPLFVSLAAAGVTPHPILLPGRAYWRERTAVSRLCEQLRPDIVHTHGARPDVMDAPAARALRIPTVTTVHGFTGGDWKNRLYERLQRRAFRKFAAVVVVSRPLREQLVRDGIPPGRIHVVQNAWEQTAPTHDRETARATLGITGDEFRLGWVGRLSREKGLDVLIEALARPPLADLPCRLSVVGSGIEEPGLRVRARALGVDQRIQWHGAIPEVARQFAAFDALVLSSRTEGTPMVLFEAMATHVPIVAARVGGVPDVVSPAEAFLVPPEDPTALAEAIGEVYDHAADARARAQRGHERLVSDFTIAPWLGRYAAVYRHVAVQHAPRVVAV